VQCYYHWFCAFIIFVKSVYY